uniref:Si:ch73-21g5.7 n=1 Tax=Paramormyrops kingsleyae TaxID=1676925 RepID=A0A3B3SHM5_9TELE
CKILSLERKCTNGVGRLKTAIGEHFQNGLPNPDMWEKTLSLLSVKRAPLFSDGYSRCSREVLRLFPDPADDVTPLCCQQ